MALDSDIPHQDLTYKIIGSAMRVHRRLKPGLPEKHYQRAMTAELIEAGLTVEEDYFVEVFDENSLWLGRLYPDHLVNGLIPVEDKSVARPLNNQDIAQTIGYLAALDKQVGLLINFGRSSLEHRRILRPKTVQDWQQKVQPFLWRPPGSTSPPLNDKR